MKEETKANLRAAWGGPLTADEVAAKHHQSSGRVVRRFWQNEVALGRLPLVPRPHFAPETSRQALAARAEAVKAPPPSTDADDADEPMPTIPAGDPLLARLKAVHGRDPVRGYVDTFPMPDDRAGNPNVPGSALAPLDFRTRSLAHMTALRFDAAVNSKMKEGRT